MVRELLRYGVDRDVTTSRGRTAYDLAAEADKLDSHRMVARLVKDGKCAVYQTEIKED